MKKTSHEEYWSDYWKSDGKSGEVFVDSHGGKPEYLRRHWSNFFSEFVADSVVVDIACGGGSVFEDIDPSHRKQFKLIATDISEQALELAEQRVPGIETFCCDSRELPLKDQSVDIVVSQFGIEYAGVSAFEEAARIVGKGGCHYKNGYIDARNKTFLNGAKTALSSGFLDASRQLIKATYTGSETKIRKAKKEFQIAEKPLANSFEMNPDGIHRHLYFGFRKLYLNYGKYRREEILKWLDDMESDIKKNIVKVTEIRSVSLDEEEIDQGLEFLSDSGLSQVSKSPFFIPDTEDVIAWAVRAKR